MAAARPLCHAIAAHVHACTTPRLPHAGALWVQAESVLARQWERPAPRGACPPPAAPGAPCGSGSNSKRAPWPLPKRTVVPACGAGWQGVRSQLWQLLRCGRTADARSSGAAHVSGCLAIMCGGVCVCVCARFPAASGDTLLLCGSANALLCTCMCLHTDPLRQTATAFAGGPGPWVSL